VYFEKYAEVPYQSSAGNYSMKLIVRRPFRRRSYEHQLIAEQLS
jgi:hypothetical protein